MADQGVKASELDEWSNTLSSNDSLVVITRGQSVPNTYIVDLDRLFTNCEFSIVLANSQNISSNNLIVRGTATPANSTSTVVSQGTIFWDANYIYVATSNNVVKRAALSTF
jgi:hypothetical protein